MKKSTLLFFVAFFVAVVSCNKENEAPTPTPTPVTPGPELVDLGLSVKWAQYNIGATKAEEVGKHFAWSDVTGQTWDGTKWSGDGFYSKISFEVDSDNNLKPAYDAAYVAFGGNYRMPTKAECKELIDNCTITSTKDYNGTGVAGAIFTGKKSGYTDKSIFLPAVGLGEDDKCTTDGLYYWSSTFCEGNYAEAIVFDSKEISLIPYYYPYGMAIRAVSK